MTDDGQQSRDEDWEQMLHDLREALHGIQCGVDLLVGMQTDAKQQRVLSRMRQDHDTVRRLVQRLAGKANLRIE